MRARLVIGSRGSKLALRQAVWIKTRISVFYPNLTTHIEVIKTTGDVSNEPLSIIGGKGVFTKELEDALLDGRIDAAAHSLKGPAHDHFTQTYHRRDLRARGRAGRPGARSRAEAKHSIP